MPLSSRIYGLQVILPDCCVFLRGVTAPLRTVFTIFDAGDVIFLVAFRSEPDNAHPPRRSM